MLRLLTTSLACIAAACGGGSGESPPALGTVTVLSASSCPSGPGNLPDTECRRLRVESRSNAPIEVEIRISEPPPGVPLIGTVVFGLGGDGVQFFTSKPGGEQLFSDLLALGFRVVDRRWESGWFHDGTSVREQSARYATLLTWLRSNLHTSGIFCAVGNSNGSAEIAYALTTWDADALLDVAVLGSGPTLSRIDYVCGAPPTATWAAQCATIVPPGALSCGAWDCNAPGKVVCPYLPPGSTPAELAEDSILHSEAQLDFPTTAVHVLIGARDCGFAPSQALLFEQAASGPIGLQFVTGGEHFVPATQGGRDAVVAALVGGMRAGGAGGVYWRVQVQVLGD